MPRNENLQLTAGFVCQDDPSAPKGRRIVAASETGTKSAPVDPAVVVDPVVEDEDSRTDAQLRAAIKKITKLPVPDTATRTDLLKQISDLESA